MKYAKAIVVKLWEMRNMFVHSAQSRAAKVLVVNKAFYSFVENELYGEAINPTFHVRVQKGRISWETGCRSSLHFCFLRCGVA